MKKGRSAQGTRSKEKLVSHLQIPKNLGVTRAIVCGDPARARSLSKLLSGARSVAKNREYHSYLGRHGGEKILIVSHGIGSAGAAICFNELDDCGIKEIVRIGTAGSLNAAVKVGDKVIPTEAIRLDGVSHLMVPDRVRAIPHRQHLSALKSVAQSPHTHFGKITTCDLFYPGVLPEPFTGQAKAGSLAVEMECSTLFVVAWVRKLRASAILLITNDALDPATGDFSPTPSQENKQFKEMFGWAMRMFQKARR